MKIESYNGPLKDIINKTFDIFRDRVLVGDDKTILCPRIKLWYEKYLNFETRPSDVWVESFPKAGTTWTQEMVWCILNDLDSKEAQYFLMKRFPFFEWDSLLPDDLSLIPKLEEGHPCNPNETWKILHKLNDPRTIKSHLHMSLLPKSIWDSKSKIIYVSRDPRDVCVSYYYHSVKLDGFTGSFDQFLDLFINDLVFYSPYWKHMLDFWEKREEDNVLFIRFEELKMDLRGNIEKVAKFLGKELSKEYLDRLENHLSFSSMSKNKAANNEEIISLEKKEDKIKFMRKGKVGDWKSHFNKDQVDRFKKWTEENLKDSDFPYYKDYD